tara:strand:- start:470760 stop:471746 length:987 start_codon:yes stop_codon:yes gene_type:complete
MTFKTPLFWYKQDCWQTNALRPLARIYGYISKKRMAKRPSYAAQCKVICVGNLTAGGGGKTPTAIALAKLANVPHTVFLTRGYGGNIKGPEIVSAAHKASDAGDEPLLLSRIAPTLISRDRVAGAKFAEQHQTKLLIMDDGLQNPKLFKDLRICVVDGPTAFGNMECIPAGPLRQPLAAGLTHVDAFIIIGDLDKKVEALLPKAVPRFDAIIEVEPDALPDEYKLHEYVAFCGIAHPHKFINTLDSINANIVKTRAFSDHHKYTEKEMHALAAFAERLDARLITTEKDFVRIPEGPWMDKIDVLPIRLKFQDSDKVSRFLQHSLSGEL